MILLLAILEPFHLVLRNVIVTVEGNGSPTSTCTQAGRQGYTCIMCVHVHVGSVQ